jgi:hypothetical protein
MDKCGWRERLVHQDSALLLLTVEQDTLHTHQFAQVTDETKTRASIYNKQYCQTVCREMNSSEWVCIYNLCEDCER